MIAQLRHFGQLRQAFGDPFEPRSLRGLGPDGLIAPVAEDVFEHEARAEDDQRDHQEGDSHVDSSAHSGVLRQSESSSSPMGFGRSGRADASQPVVGNLGSFRKWRIPFRIERLIATVQGDVREPSSCYGFFWWSFVKFREVTLE